MKIPTFEEYINERLFQKSIDRIKSGEKRQGDVDAIDVYLTDVEWVDLGHPDYLFAKEDKIFTFEDVINHKFTDDIQILNTDLHNWMCERKNCQFTMGKKTAVSVINSEKVFFLNKPIITDIVSRNLVFYIYKISQCSDDENAYFVEYDVCYTYGISRTVLTNDKDDKTIFIKLVKKK